MKEDAAKFMKGTIRTIERLARSGRVERRFLPRAVNERQARVVFLKSDLQAILDNGRSGAAPVSAGLTVQQRDQLARAALAVRSPALLPAPLEPGMRGRMATDSSRAWLTLPEAADYSGLEAAFIAHLLRTTTQIEHIGKGPKSWRILRASLDAWRPPTPATGEASMHAGGKG